MVEIISGDAALDAMNDDGQGGGNDKEFSPFKVGSEYTVKVVGTNDFFAFYSYGIYKVVNSFVAKNPSKKSAKGYPVDNLTPFDLAWKYHADKSQEFGDKESNEAYKYKPALRFAMGFYDLTSGERIVVDVSKKQAKTLRDTIKKYENKLGKVAFELSKEQGGTVALTPVLDMEDDLSDKQRENFDKAPDEFNIEDFHGILYEADDAEQIEKLQTAGFDVSLIGLEAKQGDDASESEDPTGAF